MSKLDYYIHDEADALRLQIEGDPAGPDVASLEQAWKTAKSVLDGRKLVIDLAACEADEYLKLLHRTATGRDRARHRSSKGDTSV
jgi:hypothetical protein